MPNTVYKLWLGLCLLGIPIAIGSGFSKASFYLERFAIKHATAHIQTRSLQAENPATQTAHLVFAEHKTNAEKPKELFLASEKQQID